MVVDDEPDLVELVSYNLKKEGYAVSSAPDGTEALARIKKETCDLVILDLMLPGISGMELLRIIRERPETSMLPVIMLTAKTGEVDKVLGLEMGADDYITKPFSPRELIARIKAVLRRKAAPAGKEEKILRVGDLIINKETYQVLKKGAPLNLSATEFRLLSYLAERQGKVFARGQLLERAVSVGAREMLRERERVVCLAVFCPPDALAVAAHHLHLRHAIRELQRRLQRVGEPPLEALLHDEAVDDHLDGVLLLLIEL